MLNNDKCWCECKKPNLCEKDYVWNFGTCNCENGKYLVSIMDLFHDYMWWNYRRKSSTYFICIFINYYRIIDSC